jgi:hypothetical protein
MSKLNSIVKSSKINEIKIKYDGETFKFNLNEELSINPKKINEQLKEQPSYYGWLLLLRNRLLTMSEDLERQVDKVYSSIYLATSDKINPKTNRPYSDKAAVQKALGSEKYNDIKAKQLKAKQNFNDINAVVRAFEQRANLIQTLSSNLRSETT